MEMLEFKEIAVLDKNAQYLDVPTFILMENAGMGVAKLIQERMDITNKSVVLFCGLGNNGGDGFVAARYLAKQTEGIIQVMLVGKPQDIKSTLASENFYRLPKNVEIITMDKPDLPLKKLLDLSKTAVIVDSMLGVGITGKLKKPYSSIVNLINSASKSTATKVNKTTTKKLKSSKTNSSSHPLVLSVDVPTGLGTNYAVNADITITFHDSKTGMTKKNSGEIVIHDIGIPKEAEQFVGPGDLTLLPKIKQNSHKGDHGRLLVIGAGPYTGAPALVGLSAFRIGVDLVHIATPLNAYDIVAGFSPNFIVHPLKRGVECLIIDDVKSILKLTEELNPTAIVIGPGLGRANETQEAVVQILDKLPKKIPILIDADGLNALGGANKINKDGLIGLLKAHSGVLTPHVGEFNKLMDFKSRSRSGRKNKKPSKHHIRKTLSKSEIDNELVQLQEAVVEFTKEIGPGWTVILKNYIDIITDGDLVKLNRTGNPGMTVGGTGDVLAGIIGGLLAKGVKPFHAARCGAFINGYSGDAAWNRFGNGLMATDIIDIIPQCLKEISE